MAAGNKGPISTLRSDVEIYKTQVIICAWCGLVVIIAIIGALFYAFYLIRKNRREFEAKLKNLDPLRRVTVIERPKLYPVPPVHDSVLRLQRNMDRTSYSSYNGPQRSHSELGPTSPPVDYLNINSPRPVSMANGVRNRSPNDESFLNKNRPFYYQRKREGQPTPSPKTPGGANNNVFRF